MTSDDARNREYYDDFSTHYDQGRDRGYHALIDRLESDIVRSHAPGKRVLEVGCGTGLLLSKIAPLCSHAIGLDLSEGMLQHARARGLNVVQGSATALPFDDASFDVVYSFKVLAHVPDLDKALSEIRRVTAPGGVMILEFYNRASLRYLARLLAGARRIGSAHRESDVPTRWVLPSEAAQLLDGCTIEEVHGVRVFTPIAAVHRVPLLSSIVARAEVWAARSALARFGGFLVFVARRT